MFGLQESDFVGGSDQELNDSDYVAEPKEKKARKSAPTATPKVGFSATIVYMNQVLIHEFDIIFFKA